MLVALCNIHAATLTAVSSCCWRKRLVRWQVMLNIIYCRAFMKMTQAGTGLASVLGTAVICHNMLKEYRSMKLHANKTIQGQTSSHTHAHTHTQIYRCTHRHTTQTVFLSSIVTSCVTDLISPTICWLEAWRHRSYPAWQIQTASVYACFSQGLAQYGMVESPSWPPNLHPHILTSKDLGTGKGHR